MRNLFGGERNRLREFEEALNKFSALRVDHPPVGRNTRGNEETDVATQKGKSDFYENEVNDRSQRVEDLRFRLRSFKQASGWLRSLKNEKFHGLKAILVEIIFLPLNFARFRQISERETRQCRMLSLVIMVQDITRNERTLTTS